VANLIYACWPKGGSPIGEQALRKVADRLAPLAGLGDAHHLASGPGECLCLTSPCRAGRTSGLSGCLGSLAGEVPRWHEPGTPVPDGTFALVRSGEVLTELCSDFAGSRTLWYVLTERRFLASTSQRALVALLGDLDLDREAFAWFLSSGSLGPSASWDRRIRRLGPGARLVLDRAAWTHTLHESPIDFSAEPMSPEEARQGLAETARRAVQSHDFRSPGWVLPLSGGYDCRFILLSLMEQGVRLPTVTWGRQASLGQPGNDAYVARQLARHFGLAHQYLLTEGEAASAETVVDRFLAAGEGTTDQLFPYLDGMKLWSDLAAQGIDGIIRGDEGFGWVPVGSDAQARISVGLVLLRELLPEAEAEQLSDGGQPLPEAIQRRPEETLAAYRDRLYHAYRIPVGLAALNAVKAPFVEIANPLLSRELLQFVRRMPDPFRTGKALFSKIVQAGGPPIPYAKVGADDTRSNYLNTEPYCRWMESELDGEQGQRLLPEATRLRLRAACRFSGAAPSVQDTIKAAIKRIVPGRWIRLIRAQTGIPLPGPRMVALCAALGCRTVRLLERDARTLEADERAAG
jgi:hypothetical protein